MQNKRFICFTLLILSIFFPVSLCAQGKAQQKPLTRKQALIVAEQLPEVAGLYDLAGGTLMNCIEKEVVRPCETDWVTCRDDAWVARFTVGSRCPVKHDGRLNVYIVIDEDDGQIISRFPEAPYFQDPVYCLENYDCFAMEGNGSGVVSCRNFIYDQVEGEGEQSLLCQCVKSRCEAVSQEAK